MADLIIPTDYKFGDVVALRTGTMDDKGMIVAITIVTTGSVSYVVSWGDGRESGHFAIELTLVAVAEDDFVR